MLSGIVHQQLTWMASLVILTIITSSPATSQEAPSSSDVTTSTGIVTSSTRNTLVVRGEDGQYRLFIYDRGATRPRVIAAGSQVRVSWRASDDPGVRMASNVVVLQAPTAGASAPTAGVVPAEVRGLERDIERQARRFQAGVRAGVALDPELVLLGVHAQVGPFFNPDLFLRPNVEFAFGEVTAMFGMNMEAIYRLPVTSRSGRWSTYFGLGPGFNFLHQNFERTEGGKRVDFGDFHSSVGLNVLGGIRYRNGMFMELKTSVYSKPAPTLRLIVGYNF